MSAEQRNCGNCGHGVAVPASLGQSVECHGAPPQLVVTAQGIVTMFPQPRADWLCAAWERKPVELFTATTPKTT